MARRVKALRDQTQLEKIVKGTIKQELDPCAHTFLWQSKDLELVIGHYQDFLVAIAQTGCKLDQAVLVKVLRKLFEGDSKTFNSFAATMQRGLSHCRTKGKSISSGAKTTSGVLRVCKAVAKQLRSPDSDQPPESPESSDVEVTQASEVKEDELEARKCLARAQTMFGSSSSGSELRSLKRSASVLSVASSEPEAPLEAGLAAPKGQPQKEKVHYI